MRVMEMVEMMIESKIVLCFSILLKMICNLDVHVVVHVIGKNLSCININD